MARYRNGLMLLLFGALGAAPLAHSAEIGRLFMSVAERAELDRLRHGGAPAVVRPATPPVPTDAPDAPVAERGVLALDGLVARSGHGRNTAWVDAMPHLDGERRRPATLVLPGGRGVALSLPSGRRVVLKPGQEVDLDSGKIQEAYARRRPLRRSVSEALPPQ